MNRFKTLLFRISLIFFLLMVAGYAPAQSRKTVMVSGVKVSFVLDRETFPESWKTEEIDARGASLDPAEIERSIRVVRRALEKYPADVLSRNLVKIYVLKSMKFYGVAFGGTNSSDVVYLTNNGLDNGFTEEYLEKTFHHEFSSILLRNYPELLNEKDWKAQNSIPYGKGGVEAIVTGEDGLSYDEKLMPSGFLIQYAVSDMENDFNTYAESLFYPGKELWKFYDVYPAIRKKADLIIQFYSQLDQSFTKEYFMRFTGE